jgi:hypothetical protein
MKHLSLSAEHEAELHRLLRFYHRDAKRCEAAKAYLAGCVMAAAALEAALILMVSAFPAEATATGKVPHRKSIPKPLEKWDLAELVAVAKAAEWLPAGLVYPTDEWKPSRANVGDRAEVVRLIRNLLHPGRYLEEHHRQRVTKKHLHFALNAVAEVNDWLLARIERSILERIEAKQP